MWPKEYKDYEVDKPLIKYEVSPSHGIIGCEMHELNGWGNTVHIPVKHRKKGTISLLLSGWFADEPQKKKKE